MSLRTSDTIPIRNRIRSFVGGFIRRPMVRDKEAFLQAARTSCQQIQLATLRRLLALNHGSQLSNDFGLTPSLSVDEFRNQHPVSDYELIRPYVDRVAAGNHSALLGATNKLLMFATTSGTTAAPKLIPVTNQFLADYRRGWQRWGIAAQQAHPTLKQLRMVQMISDHQQSHTQDGTPCGNISGLVTSMQRPIVRKLYAVPAATAKIQDADAKRYATLRFALAERWVGMLVTANPATLLRLCSAANQHAEALIKDIHDGTLTNKHIEPDVHAMLSKTLKKHRLRALQLQKIINRSGQLTPQDCWPQLACLGVWTGGSAAAFGDELRNKFGGVPIRDHGLHASEGRMTIPFTDNSPVGLLDIESHFFEFVPIADIDSEAPKTLLAHELQQNAEYYILLTTASGLYRYNIRDVVRCCGYHGSTPLLEFLHKGHSISSITGEKISESQVVQAVTGVETCVSLSQFTLTPHWRTPPFYKLHIGTSGALAEQLQQLGDSVDAALMKLNCEYQDKRNSGRLGPIECEVVDQHDWDKFRKQRLAVSGGSEEQYKHPCLLPDPKFNNIFWSTISATE